MFGSESAVPFPFHRFTMAHRKLGEILISSGVINEAKLEQALKYQKQNKCLIGEALIRLGHAEEEAIAQALSKQLGVPYASIENKILIPEKGQNLEKLVSEKYSREHFLIPLFIEGNSIAVAMADPTNILAIDNLRLMTNREIQPFIATKSQVLGVIDEYYQASDLIEAAMSSKDTAGKEVFSEADVVSTEGKLDLDKVIVGDTKGVQSIRIVNAILKQAINERSSDIHLELFEERVSLRFRIDGVLYERTPSPKDIVNI